MKDDILDASRQLLAEKGTVDAVSIREVADRVGVSPPAIYMHFATKDELFFQCCRGTYTELTHRLASVSGLTTLDRLEGMARVYIRFGLERSADYLVLFSGEYSSETPDDPGVQAFEDLVGIIRDGIENGEVRPDLDPELAAVALWGAVHGLVMVVVGRVRVGRFSISLPNEETLVETLLTMMREGLGIRD